MRFVWPEGPSFRSQFACKSLPKRGNALFSNVVLGPITNLIDITSASSFVVSWALLIGLWYLVQALPIGAWNSSDDQYLDTQRMYISTALAYFLICALLISRMQNAGCAELVGQAEEYLYGPKPPMPITLQNVL